MSGAGAVPGLGPRGAPAPICGPTVASAADLGGQVRRGLVWSTANNVVVRLASLALGVVLARLLSPGEFGVYAIALSVQAVLVAVADLGLSAELIRHDDAERRAPTVATLATSVGLVLTVLMIVTSHGLATALGSEQAGPTIAVLALTLVLAGFGVVPFATLQRRFDQRSLFLVGAVDLLVSSAVTIGLLLAGAGVVSLAVGRVVAQCVTVALQFVLAGQRPRFGLDRTLVRGVLAFGLPVAGANLLSWAVLGIDKVVLGRAVGVTALGFYVLAFNISAWPMTLVGQVVRSVSLPLFARLQRAGGRSGVGPVHRGDPRLLARVMAPVWVLAVLCGAGIAAVAAPLVLLLYGGRWAAAAPLVVPLAAFGALRVLADLFAAYLYALGRSRAVLGVQCLWFGSLVAGLLVGTRVAGVEGAAWAQLVVAGGVVVTAYLLVVTAHGASARALLGALGPPAAVGVLAAFVGHRAAALATDHLAALLVGSATTLVVVAALLGRWFLRRLREALPRRTSPGWRAEGRTTADAATTSAAPVAASSSTVVAMPPAVTVATPAVLPTVVRTEAS